MVPASTRLRAAGRRAGLRTHPPAPLATWTVTEVRAPLALSLLCALCCACARPLLLSLPLLLACLTAPPHRPSPDLDLFVGNEGGANELWLNDGSGEFTAASGGPTGGSAYTRTSAFADVDGDGGARASRPLFALCSLLCLRPCPLLLALPLLGWPHCASWPPLARCRPIRRQQRCQ